MLHVLMQVATESHPDMTLVTSPFCSSKSNATRGVTPGKTSFVDQIALSCFQFPVSYSSNEHAR